ncbi:MAG TPA: carbamoyltransferase HypF, partial [Acetobacteraceae bacterium]|nr:carbamoyltransferase HypF [Acetobacteraceae bacterium]
VVIEVEGRDLGPFLAALRGEAPPLARLEAIEARPAAPRGERGFAIAASAGGRIATRLPPDSAPCEACLDELFDPASRFHLYPFVTCTQCGPRYTLTRALPYDRGNTGMAGFAMCPACARDYADPDGRRFHAEPIACPDCGPRLSHPVADIVAALRAGRIVALKGLGGFHLLCDARREAAVAALRRRKGREAKPFAVMLASPASLEGVVAMEGAARALLCGPARPIVLARHRGALALSVAPGLAEVGVMLPCTPLHHLLFHAAAGAPPGRAWQQAPVDLALVATSANPGGEPLVTDNEEAHQRLAGIADLIVTHDRPIVIRADDSVMRIVAGQPAFLRRARGFTPDPVTLAQDGPPVLALGGHLKVTATLTRGREAFVSQHVGDLDTAGACRFLDETIAHLTGLLGVRPRVVAHDLHPDFLTTRLAARFGVPTLPVQHHHAHAAAVAAEHGVTGPYLGLVLDGYGLGSDGGNWGGEMLRVAPDGFSRLGHLAPLPLPGGDRAAREPWRMAAAALSLLGRGESIAARFPGRPGAALAAMLARGAFPSTTSAGRLFDAAAGLLGVMEVQHDEGQAAMELEALVAEPRVLPGGWRLDGGVLDLSPLLAALAVPGVPVAEGAGLFHGTLAAALADWAAWAAQASGLTRIVLGGGCFLNRVLTEALLPRLAARGLQPLCARAVPANDGGLSLGQAAIAAAQFAARE